MAGKKTTTVNTQPAASTARASGVAFEMAYVTYPVWQDQQGPTIIVYENPGTTVNGTGVTLGTAVTVVSYVPPWDT